MLEIVRITGLASCILLVNFNLANPSSSLHLFGRVWKFLPSLAGKHMAEWLSSICV